MLNNNGFVMRAGSNKDMAIAYVFRVFTVIVQGVGALLLWALLNLAVSIRDDTRDIKKEWPGIKSDISELKEQGKTFATKKQLEDAEQRVKDEFKKRLEEQVSADKLQTGGALKRGRP